MPKPTKGTRLGASPSHQAMMLNGMASQLIVHERIRTTETKAKRLRPVAEKLITLGKDGSVHARRRALRMIEDREVIHKLFADVAPRFADRNGGYTRVLKLGTRQGDAAPMAIIELVEGAVEAAPSPDADQKRRRGLRRRKPAKIPEAEASAVETSEVEEAQAPAANTVVEPEVQDGAGEAVTTAAPEAAATPEAEIAEPEAGPAANPTEAAVETTAPQPEVKADKPEVKPDKDEETGSPA
ncbi:MAG: 50S ribosomal protein L17 [Actinomycetota bacterium]